MSSKIFIAVVNNTTNVKGPRVGFNVDTDIDELQKLESELLQGLEEKLVSQSNRSLESIRLVTKVNCTDEEGFEEATEFPNTLEHIVSKLVKGIREDRHSLAGVTVE
jgi:predicted glycosyl hydrolase (DUF1957 family)